MQILTFYLGWKKKKKKDSRMNGGVNIKTIIKGLLSYVH